jgi:hypothetical protein
MKVKRGVRTAIDFGVVMCDPANGVTARACVIYKVSSVLQAGTEEVVQEWNLPESN